MSGNIVRRNNVLGEDAAECVADGDLLPALDRRQRGMNECACFLNIERGSRSGWGVGWACHDLVSFFLNVNCIGKRAALRPDE
jgi:hypothetical protein